MRRWLTLGRSVDDGRSSREQRGRGAGRGRKEGRLWWLLERSRARWRLWGSYLRTKLILLTREREGGGGESESEREGGEGEGGEGERERERETERGRGGGGGGGNEKWHSCNQWIKLLCNTQVLLDLRLFMGLLNDAELFSNVGLGLPCSSNSTVQVRSR